MPGVGVAISAGGSSAAAGVVGLPIWNCSVDAGETGTGDAARGWWKKVSRSLGDSGRRARATRNGLIVAKVLLLPHDAGYIDVDGGGGRGESIQVKMQGSNQDQSHARNSHAHTITSSCGQANTTRRNGAENNIDCNGDGRWSVLWQNLKKDSVDFSKEKFRS